VARYFQAYELSSLFIIFRRRVLLLSVYYFDYRAIETWIYPANTCVM